MENLKGHSEKRNDTSTEGFSATFHKRLNFIIE